VRDSGESRARELDREDPLASFREEFHLPRERIYLCGNSLGLQPVAAGSLVRKELEEWAALGVEGHFRASRPWMSYHELLSEPLARLVGALPSEVVVMNSLTVNLHLMLVAFYRPTSERYKILIEGGAFPSDRYAVRSQAAFHGYHPDDAVVELLPRDGEDHLRPDDILTRIDEQGEEIALVLLGNANYYTGQAFDVAAISRAGGAKGCRVGFDLAHGVGNLLFHLHDDGPDFAVWCSYKYLNGGPGAVGGAFVHERHRGADLPRFAGWWGHDKATRFEMGPTFASIPGAEGFQLSNPPILQLAALRASLEIFDRAGMAAVRHKSERLTGYLESLLRELPHSRLRVVTPGPEVGRGAQLSLRVSEGTGRRILARLEDAGVVCDYREPDVVRVAPVPLYNSFLDVYRFSRALIEGS
jgi:kynureninase